MRYISCCRVLVLPPVPKVKMPWYSVFLLRLGESLDVFCPLMLNDPDRCDEANDASEKSNAVGAAVTLKTVVARSFTRGLDYTVGIINLTIEQIKDIRRNDGRERDEAPILAHAADAKPLGHDGWEDTKEEPITQA